MARWLPALILLVAGPAAAADDTCMEAVGAAHGANLFNTYTAIGAIADGYGKGVYDESDVQDLMTTEAGFIKALTGSLTKLEEQKGVSKQDRKALHQFIATYALLDAQARALLTYAKSNEDEDLKRFDEARKKAWTRIEDILGLSTQPKKSPPPTPD